MKRFYFTILICFASVGAYSQMTWAPDGAVWHYTYNSMCHYGYTRIGEAGDTSINGTVCSILQPLTFVAYMCFETPSCCMEWPEAEIYTYAYDDHVYYHNGNGFEMIYDFTLNVGDTMTIGYNGLCQPGKIVVSETGIMEMNGFSLRYYDAVWQQTDTTMHLGDRIVERIGAIGYSYMIPQPACMIDIGGNGPFICYADPEFGFFTDNTPYDCEYILSINEQEIDLQIAPNPVESYLHVSVPPLNSSQFDIYVLDTFGREVQIELELSAAGSVRIDMSALPSGLYLVRCIFDEKSMLTKVIKS